MILFVLSLLLKVVGSFFLLSFGLNIWELKVCSFHSIMSEKIDFC